MKIPQCSRVRASVPHRGLGIRGGAGPGAPGHETCGKEAVLPLSPPRAGRRPPGGHAPPSFRPQGPGLPLGLRSTLPRGNLLKLLFQILLLIPLRILATSTDQ